MHIIFAEGNSLITLCRGYVLFFFNLFSLYLFSELQEFLIFHCENVSQDSWQYYKGHVHNKRLTLNAKNVKR